MANLQQIMRRAWVIAKDHVGEMTFSDALRMSWAIDRGFSHGFETSYLDGGKLVRRIGFAASYNDAHSDCIEAKRWIVAAGFKPTGSSEFGLRKYMPQQIEIAVPLKQAA